MASNLKYAATLKNAQLDAITTALGASGFLDIYDGTQPASPDTAITTQNKLAHMALSATAAGAASGGVLTFSAIADDASADFTGTASWFRMTTSGGTAKVDGTVGTSGTDLIINNTSITATQVVSASGSITITAGN